MRTSILLLLILSLGAADVVPAFPREDFTLTDGRTFTGTFDEVANMLTLDGGKVGLHVTVDQIKERAPAKAELVDKPMVEKKKPAVVAESRKVTSVAQTKPLSRAEQAAQMEADATAMEAKAKKIMEETVPIRINPRNANRELEAVPEWIIGTPEYADREKRLNKLLAEVMGLENGALKMRALAAETRGD